MSQRMEALKFETGRVKALQEERLHIQKKTFTKWVNSFLVKARMEVEDIFTDLGEGKKLLKLLEIISGGEQLGKPNTGRLRFHKIENINKSLAFLHTKVRLESIGAEDIVDGNPRLILGLLWTIILRFQIQEIEIDLDEDNEISEKTSSKEALLLWCQRKTTNYANVNINDFSSSWRNGLGFNALIHAHRPDLVDFDSLVAANHISNLSNAFEIAEKHLGIFSLLDPEDCDTAKPDDKSVLTYVASYYHAFRQMDMENNVISSSPVIENLIPPSETISEGESDSTCAFDGSAAITRQTQQDSLLHAGPSSAESLENIRNEAKSSENTTTMPTVTGQTKTVLNLEANDDSLNENPLAIGTSIEPVETVPIHDLSIPLDNVAQIKESENTKDTSVISSDHTSKDQEMSKSVSPTATRGKNYR